MSAAASGRVQALAVLLLGALVVGLGWGGVVRSPDELAFILARTRQWIAENAPRGPLLVERAETVRSGRPCKRGHVDQRNRYGTCTACKREGRRKG